MSVIVATVFMFSSSMSVPTFSFIWVFRIKATSCLFYWRFRRTVELSTIMGAVMVLSAWRGATSWNCSISMVMRHLRYWAIVLFTYESIFHFGSSDCRRRHICHSGAPASSDRLRSGHGRSAARARRSRRN